MGEIAIVIILKGIIITIIINVIKSIIIRCKEFIKEAECKKTNVENYLQEILALLYGTIVVIGVHVLLNAIIDIVKIIGYLIR